MAQDFCFFLVVITSCTLNPCNISNFEAIGTGIEIMVYQTLDTHNSSK